MKTKVVKVNGQYYHLYSTFTKNEMKKLFADVLKEQKVTLPYHELTDEKQAKVIQTVKEKIENEEIIKEMQALDIAIISEILYIYRTDISPENVLFVISKMCVVVEEMELEFPEGALDMRKYRVPLKLINNAIDKILFYYSQVEEETQEEINESTLKIKVEVVTEEDLIDNAIFSEKELKETVDFKMLMRLKVKDYLPEQIAKELGYKSIQIQKILHKKTLDLSDQVAQKMSFLGTQTKKDFLEKVKRMIVQSEKRNYAVKILLESLIDSSDIELKEEVMNHMMEVMAKHLQIPFSEVQQQMDAEKEVSYKSLRHQVLKQYIVHYAYLEYPYIPFQEYYGIIKEEHTLQTILGMLPNTINRYELFFKESMDNFILFHFFVQEGSLLI